MDFGDTEDPLIATFEILTTDKFIPGPRRKAGLIFRDKVQKLGNWREAAAAVPLSAISAGQDSLRRRAEIWRLDPF
jgi:hypothetical protein